MKWFNRNILVFVAACVIIGFGFSKTYFEELGKAFETFSAQAKETSVIEAFDKLTGNIDRISTKQLKYHYDMMDLNSIKDNLTNTKIITKNSDTIAKSNTGSLIKTYKRIPDKDFDVVVERINNLYAATKEAGAEFLYVAAPLKGYRFSMPENVDDAITDNTDRFLAKMEQAQIPCLDLAGRMIDEGIYSEDLFYRTDHHWKAETGLWAAGAICDTLEQRYGFMYDSYYNDLNNYSVVNYPQYFLGSYGKKTGVYFSGEGADDFHLILPDFETKITELQPFKNFKRTGLFTSSVLYMSRISQKDYYKKNPYATYSGGDYRLQIFKNHYNPDGAKVLLIRDSYACVVAPFLCLNTSELHMLDMRNYSSFVGEKVNAYEYIQKIDPDYVMVLFSGALNIASASGKYDFD